MKPLMTADEAAPLLNVPASWLKKAVTDPDFPCTRIGRYVRFDEDDLEAIKRRGRRHGRRAAAA
jgi:excisionase family DNA binding protein